MGVLFRAVVVFFPKGKDRLVFADFKRGIGVMFCFPSAELAGKVDVPVVFHALVFALMQVILLQIAIDEGVECNVCAVVRDVSQAIRRCNFAIILAQSGKDLNERREQFIDGIAVQVSAEVALLAWFALWAKKNKSGPCAPRKYASGAASMADCSCSGRRLAASSAMSAWVMEDGILLSYEMRILRVIIAIVVNCFSSRDAVQGCYSVRVCGVM